MGDPWPTISIFAMAVWTAMGLLAVSILWATYLSDRSYRRRHRMPSGFVSLTLASISTVVFVGGAWSAFLTIRRMLGFEPYDWATIVTVPLLLLALSVPIMAAAIVIYQRYRY